MARMTNDEILERWNEIGYMTDWAAVDSYDPCTTKITRLFVGTEEEAERMMEIYNEPTSLALQPFHRCSMISPDEAKAFFEGIQDELHERGVLSLTEAAEALGVSRQRVHALLKSGKLDGYKVGNSWNISAESVEKRLETA